MTLGPLNILAPLLLLGVLAAAIPVLLHLLAKVRAPQVYFPTLRFLRLSMEKTARRRRVQHWLLLLLRMLAMAVLAIAVAQPLYRAARGQLGSDRDTAVVVVLDNSLSMQTRQRGSSWLESARASAVEFLEAHNFQQVSLVVTNGPPGRSPPQSLTDRFKAIDQAKKVNPGAGRADLAAAIGHAQQLLASTNLPNREIYLFSDLQRASARGLAAVRQAGRPAAPVPSLLAVTCRPVTTDSAGAGPTNLAVTDIAIDQPNLTVGQPVQLEATVRNFSRLAQKAMVRVFQDGRERPEMLQVIDLSAWPEAGATQHIGFSLAFGEPGSHSGWVQVQRVNPAGLPDNDDLPEDDCRYFALELADRVNILLVKQRHDLDVSTDGGYLLRRLTAVHMPGGPVNPFRLTEITAAEFVPSLLANMQVVITSDLAGFSPEELAAYRRFAERGGTWIIWLGPSADLNAYNEALTRPTSAPDEDVPATPLLDGQFVRYMGAGTGGRDTEGEPVFIQWVDESHAMFQKVYPDLSAYRRVLVHRHAVLRVRPDQPGRAVARLNTTDPLVFDTPVGKGRILLFTTGASARWSNWLAQHQAFAVYQVLLASGGRGRRASAGQFHENEPVAIELPAAMSGVGGGPIELTVRRPDQQVVTIQAGMGGPAGRQDASALPSARFVQTDQAGLYHWQVVGSPAGAAGGQSARGAFAVNPPGEESDLQPLAERELAELLPDRPVLVARSVSELAGKVEQFRKGTPWWPFLLAAVLVLLAVEVKVANRHRPTIAGGLRPVFGGGGAAVEPASAGKVESAVV